jgi:hypothetical protein
MENIQPTPKNLGFHHTDDFSSVYANHIHMEASVWDLKLLFGELDQSVDPLIVEQHTAVTIPWRQAKLLIYFLKAQLVAYEIVNGKIDIPASVRPPKLDPPTEEIIKQEPLSQQIYEAFEKLRQELLASL